MAQTVVSNAVWESRHNRRRVTLVIATPGTVRQDVWESYREEVEASMRAIAATETLRQEHRSISVVLDFAEEVAGRISRGEHAPPEVLAKMMEFIRLFVDQCHHGK